MLTYLSLLIAYMYAKNEVIENLYKKSLVFGRFRKKLNYYAREDIIDAVQLFSEKEAGEFLKLLPTTTIRDSASCPFCKKYAERYNPKSTCGKCSYGKRHGICDLESEGPNTYKTARNVFHGPLSEIPEILVIDSVFSDYYINLKLRRERNSIRRIIIPPKNVRSVRKHKNIAR